ncbi:hypothetical protein DSO57_1002524 [Entomophthora muscae]|uniref:Uncharacterized protein n=1 Tax=Entomophthora muscae TaxID=34485 RepID=A0ACC2SLG4_9FUNG|nr:hypothetical protein DSO57_1002524 [Entomophthora muscae]
MVEKANGTLVGILKMLAADKPSSWDDYLTCAAMAYRVTSHTTSSAPRLSAPIPPKANKVNYSKNVLELTRRIAALQDKAFKNLVNSHVQSFLRDQDALLPLPQLEVGDQVLMYREHLSRKPNKLQSLWTEPHEVLEKTGMGVYTLKDLVHGNILNRVHAKYLKRAPMDEHLTEVGLASPIHMDN